ncbi:MAG: molybdopterin-dependent oxidoreductase [Archaeoglobaceae archaeon]
MRLKNFRRGNMAINSLKLSRRGFIKATAAGIAVAAGVLKYAKTNNFFKKAEATTIEEESQEEGAQLIKTVCTHCAVGCGVLGKVKDGQLVGIEPWVDNPVNGGSLCCKGASINHTVTSPKRLRYPMIKRNGRWEKISWDEAINTIADKMMEIRENYGPDSVFFAGSAKVSNEMAYLQRKFMAFWGSNNIDHQARICHSTTVAGLGNTWGYGAMTNNFNDVRNCKSIFFLSNPAEAHPVSFKHIYEAKNRGAVLICGDPRFSRTAAVSDLHLQFRTGTDIPLIWGIAYEIINNGWYDEEFVEKRTFGFEEAKKVIMEYPPEVASDITGVPVDKIKRAAYLLATNKPGTLQYAMGATQHAYGSQNIRSFAILQLLLGNAGQPGGGVNAFRGHDNVQGATDMCVLSHTLPSYYGLGEGAWQHWAGVWGVDYEWLKDRFYNEEFMGKNGFTMSRFSCGILAGTDAFPACEDLTIDQPNNIKMMFMWGHSTPAIGDIRYVKKAFENVELLVFVDPFVESGAALADRQDGIIILPAATQLETSGSVTNSGRQIQWRNKIIEPLYDSKEDMWIMFRLVKALDRHDSGLYERFTRNFGNKDPEEITSEEVNDKEIMVGARAIGMIGQKSDRLKRQQDYDYTFDEEDCQAKGGPLEGEYWGLPWPCWNDRHPGTPILYRNDIPAWEGGHDFRVRWGTDYEGTTLLSGVNGHDQVTIDDVAWSRNLETDYGQVLDENKIPTGRGRARLYAWNMTDPVPIHREPIYTERKDLIDKYPTYDESQYGTYHYRVPVLSRVLQEACKTVDLAAHFPLEWTSGRQVEHMGGGAGTRANKILAELQPEMYAEINPIDANSRGINDEDLVIVITPRGLEYGSDVAKVVCKARVTGQVAPGLVFLPFHWGGSYQGESYLDRFPVTDDMDTRPYVSGDSANTANCPGWDVETQMQNTKSGICDVMKYSEYRPPEGLEQTMETIMQEVSKKMG